MVRSVFNVFGKVLLHVYDVNKIKQKAASILLANNVLYFKSLIKRRERKFSLPIKYRSLQQRIGNSSNNKSIDDLVFTVFICTFLLRCYSVAKDFVEGRVCCVKTNYQKLELLCLQTNSFMSSKLFFPDIHQD